MSTSRFLADEDLRYAIVLAARRLEPALSFATASEVGLGSRPDDEVLGFARREGWLVVSHDVHTMIGLANERIQDGRGIAGLFLVPQSRSTRAVAESLVLIWACVAV